MKEFRLYALLIAVGAVSASVSVQNALAQHPKGIVLCLAACSKSDKGCQDRCVPRALRAEARACIETCRQSAAVPDLVAEMTRCVSACGAAPTQ